MWKSNKIFLRPDLEEKQYNSGLRCGFWCETDLDGNISYLIFFGLIYKMGMIVVSISKVFMKVYLWKTV